MQDDGVERVYDYLRHYTDQWRRPPLLDEIVEDLSLTARQAMQVLALLQNGGRVRPGSLRPKALP